MAARNFCRLFLRRLLPLIVLSLAPAAMIAQGGPPLRTESPETPGNKNWEINVAYGVDRAQNEHEYEAPILDINYGLGDRIQLKYETNYVLGNEDNEPLRSGPGNSKFGIKYRFLQDEKRGLNLSTFPMLVVNNTKNSVDRGLAEDGPMFLLPVEVSQKVGKVDLNLEAGHWFTQDKGYWIAGLAGSIHPAKRLEVMAEVYSDGNPENDDRNNTFDFGGRIRLSRHVLLLCMAGRSFSGPNSGQSQFMGYFGMQFQLGKHLRVDEEREEHEALPHHASHAGHEEPRR